MSTSDTQTTPPAAIPPRPGAPGEDFFARIREFGIVRPDEGRWAAGVASGLAHRWGVDPLLVRGGFVALTIVGGIGVAVYGLCWLFLPHPDGRIHAQEVLSGTVTAGFVGAALASLSAIGDVSGNAGPLSWGPWRGVVPLVLIGLVIWWAVAKKGGHGPQWMHGTPGTTAGTQTTDSTSYEPGVPGATTDEWTGRPGTSSGWAATPPASGPVPYTAPVRAVDRTAPKHALTLSTLGIALVSGTLAGAVRSWTSGTASSAWLVGSAVALAVVALGLVVAGLIGRRGGGLVPVAIFLVIASLNGVLWRGPIVTFGDRTWTPVAASEITADGFRQGAGQIVLDLRDPRLLAGATAESPLRIPVQVGAGHLVIKVPPSVTAEVDARVGFGEIADRINNRTNDGGGNTSTITSGAGKPVVVVTADLGAGQLEVTT